MVLLPVTLRVKYTLCSDDDLECAAKTSTASTSQCTSVAGNLPVPF